MSIPAVTAGGQPGEGRALPWWWLTLLALPALLPLANAWIFPGLHGKVATGFLQIDGPYYVANARAYFEHGFHLTYSNPYAAPGSPAIYFQPQILLLGCIQKVGLDPGVAYSIFTLLALFFAVWMAARFYAEVVGFESRAKRLAFCCFFWGGGILSLAGLAAGLLSHRFGWGAVSAFDPFGGWWFLNFGRNLVYPNEAYYHGLFLLCLWLLIRRRFAATLAIAALMSLSHPFTGLTLALILMTYSALECALRSRAVHWAVLAGSAGIAFLHIWHYVFFLNRFAEHRVLQAQWRLDWFYRPTSYIPALFIVAAFVAIRLGRPPGLRALLKDPRNRLYLVWFATVFALSQHNLLIPPVQPIHFAHGYDWMALFFLGAPIWVLAFERILTLPRPAVRAAVLAAFLGFVLLDNALWLGQFFHPSRDVVLLSRDEKSVLDWLAEHARPAETVVWADWVPSYLLPTYTSVRGWQGHPLNTPNFDQRWSETKQAFTTGRILPEWRRMPVIYVSHRGDNWHPPEGVRELYSNAEFSIWGRR